MGWRINLVKNDLPLTPAAEADINKLDDEHGVAAKAIDGKLYFNPGHLEWMDYVWEDEVDAVLKKHKVNGEVLFSSSDGDNAGKAWGYRYTDGELAKLVRTNTGEWVEEGSVAEEDLEVQETGNEPTDLSEAQRGDTVAVGFNFMGLTSYERSTVGDILPDGVLVVDGREFKAPNWQFRDLDNPLGGSFVLRPVAAVPAGELEDE